MIRYIIQPNSGVTSYFKNSGPALDRRIIAGGRSPIPRPFHLNAAANLVGFSVSSVEISLIDGHNINSILTEYENETLRSYMMRKPPKMGPLFFYENAAIYLMNSCIDCKNFSTSLLLRPKKIPILTR